MSQMLSEILTVPSEFYFFNVVAMLEPFDSNKLETIIDDLISYSESVYQIFIYLAQREKNGSRLRLEWLAEGSHKFYDVHTNIDSIDSIVLQALNLLENNIEKDPSIVDSEIFNKLDELGELSLKIKQNYLIPFKKKIDLAGEYNEIFNITMNSINRELENCLKKCFRIHEKRYSSPVRHAPKFNLDMLTNKLLQQRSNLKLPLLNEVDSELYQEYLELKMIVDPLRTSLNFIPERLEDFQAKYKNSFEPYDIDRLTNKYNSLVTELDYLQKEVDDLKYQLVDSRWNEIFSYLNTEISFLITGVEKELNKIASIDSQHESIFKSQIFKRLKYTTDIVENTFTLINQAIDEKLVDLNVVEISNRLADFWLSVKDNIPEEYIEKIVNDDDNLDKDMAINFKKLSFERKKEHDDNVSETTSEKERRRSRAGHFLMGKMNLIPVMIEKDPIPVRQQEELKSVLTETFKHNQIQDDTPSKNKSESKRIGKIPNLLPPSNTNYTINGFQKKTNECFISPIEEEEIFTKEDAREETFRQLLGDVDQVKTNGIPSLEYLDKKKEIDVFKTPVSKRNTSNSSVIISKSVESPTINYDDFKSKIPRLISKVYLSRSNSKIEEKIQNPSRITERSTSNIDSNKNRSITSLSLSRAIKKRPESRIGYENVTIKRHSMLLYTPNKQNSITGSSSRKKSLLPQPTPIKQILDKSSEKSFQRLNTGHHLSGLGIK